ASISPCGSISFTPLSCSGLCDAVTITPIAASFSLDLNAASIPILKKTYSIPEAFPLKPAVP
uniref:Uncharacterized protein n=1 Tax=Ciona savignyi TaxID=51511 RepID=H2YFA7_CIOSA